MTKNQKIIIGLISFIAVVLVLLSIYAPDFHVEDRSAYMFLPKLNATLNGLSFIALIISYISIKKGHKKYHVLFIFIALLLTLFFLVSYLFYHFISPPTAFGGTGYIKVIYLVILLTHVFLAAAIVPLIMITILYAIQKDYTRHKKIAKWTLPLWLYVGFTGVIIYLMNSAYY
jgi:putative membrane protein